MTAFVSPSVIEDGNTVAWYIADESIVLRTTVVSDGNIDWALDTFAILRILFNGANSSIQVNNNAATTENPGADNADGFTLGARGNDNNPSNIEVKEVILRKIADAAGDEQDIYDYLKSKYGL